MTESKDIIDVWDSNFYEELAKVVELIPHFNFIAMVRPVSHPQDTEFPGGKHVPKSITSVSARS